MKKNEIEKQENQDNQELQTVSEDELEAVLGGFAVRSSQLSPDAELADIYVCRSGC